MRLRDAADGGMLYSGFHYRCVDCSYMGAGGALYIIIMAVRFFKARFTEVWPMLMLLPFDIYFSMLHSFHFGKGLLQMIAFYWLG